MGEHRLRQCRARLACDGCLGVVAVRSVACHAIDHARRAVCPLPPVSSGSAITKDQQMIVEMPLRLVRQLLPAMTDVYTRLLEPPEQCHCSRDIEQVVGRFWPHLAI
jgi:hypothetical protein